MKSLSRKNRSDGRRNRRRLRAVAAGLVAAALACRALPARAPAVAGGLPDPPDLDGVLLVRERFVVAGVERSANRVERFDAAGCWSMAANTWLWVTDPGLRRASARGLHFNAPFGPRWFCLEPGDLAELRAAIAASRFSSRPVAAGEVAERWSAPGAEGPRVATFPVGRPPPGLTPLVEALLALAGRGVWGLSPEDGAAARGEAPGPGPPG